VTIDHITLINPVNVVHEADIILPVPPVESGDSAVGIVDWQPTTVSAEVWAGRQDAAGGIIESGGFVNLLTVIGRGEMSPDGYADAVEVRESDNTNVRGTAADDKPS